MIDFLMFVLIGGAIGLAVSATPFGAVVTEAAEATVHQLLAHTSADSEFGNRFRAAWRKITKEEWRARAFMNGLGFAALGALAGAAYVLVR